MKTEIKALWTDALRSGVYTQTQNHLRDAKGFCCLGVLCDIAKDQIGAQWGEMHPTGCDFIYGDGIEAGCLPPVVQEWAGLSDRNPGVNIGTTGSGSGPHAVESRASLANLNDSGMSFREIADIIEKSL